jgi:hypothetical protein
MPVRISVWIQGISGAKLSLILPTNRWEEEVFFYNL